MTDRELNITLREMARAKGLCDDWYGKWGDDDTIDMCLDRYIRGFDFALKYEYPTLDFICKHFRKEDLHRHNIFVDEEVSLDGDNGYYCFLGSCRATLSVDGFKAVTVYVRHNSEVNVTASNGAKVFVRYYDNSKGECIDDGWSVCKKYERKNNR